MMQSSPENRWFRTLCESDLGLPSAGAVSGCGMLRAGAVGGGSGVGRAQRGNIAFVGREHALEVVELHVVLRQIVRHLFNQREFLQKTVIGSQQ